MSAIAALGGLAFATVVFLTALEIDSQERKQFSKRDRLRVIAFGLSWQLVSFFYVVVIGIGAIFRGRAWMRQAASHAAAEGIGKLLCTIFFGKVRVEGLEHIPQFSNCGESRPRIVAPNHSSMVDILLCAHLTGDFTWVAKTSVFLVPGVGALLWMAGTVPINRGKKSSALQMLEGCREALDDGWSVLIYPQGTRSRGKWLPWKYGAFKLAVEKQVDVVPVSIVLPDDTWTSSSCELLIRCHEPVKPPPAPASVEEMTQERKHMDEALRERMDAAINTMSQEVSKRALSAFPPEHAFFQAHTD